MHYNNFPIACFENHPRFYDVFQNYKFFHIFTFKLLMASYNT